MKRYKYGLRGNWSNRTLFGLLTPLQFHEVVPGDTVSGSIDITYRSATCANLLLNDAFVDTYAFYIPYRLLWDQFPKFISEENPGILPPTVTSTWGFMFENQFQSVPGGGPATTLVPWQRRAYHHIWDKFFRESKLTPVTNFDAVTTRTVLLRPSKFHPSYPEGS